MPELPDLTVYVEALERRIGGRALKRVRLASPFLLRTMDPPLQAIHGRKVVQLRLLGKRLVFGFEDAYFLILHLMIAGRLQWRPADAKLPGRIGLAAFDFEDGTLVLTEASTRKRASLHLVHGEAALADFDRGGLSPFDTTLEAFSGRLREGNHTLKRALTDPRMLSGIGNAYSDEILHRAQLSPVKLTQRLSEAEFERLFVATRSVLEEWTTRLREQVGSDFPAKVTAFRPEMAVHGKYGAPCPVCGTRVQRIVHAENETNYCPRCQTDGKLLADRSLSKLLKKDWPRSIDELEQRQPGAD
ncbi:MAG TPA: DNA-formamidopyrimidine glycosylase family protein [Myxococcaceae bacterium]|nr:DNA-formamidopyrimidine glycosylase family protein [Myxococcaceae bacterium]